MERANMEPVIIEDLVDFGFEQGIEQGLARGRAEGVERGRAEGVERAARAVIAVLEARALSASDAVLARVTACHDPDTLKGWLRRAAVATHAEDIFDG
jgi:hypothetical protein